MQKRNTVISRVPAQLNTAPRGKSVLLSDVMFYKYCTSTDICRKLVSETISMAQMLAAPKWIRHPKEGPVNRHRADPRFPLSAPQGGPRSAHAFGFTRREGDYKRSALEEYSDWRALEWKLRINGIFHHTKRRSRATEHNQKKKTHSFDGYTAHQGSSRIVSPGWVGHE